MDEAGLWAWLDGLVGGAVTTLIAATVGRLMYHTGEVKSGNRRFFSKELLWELPVAFGMALIGEALAGYLELAAPISTGLIVLLSYLGPRGVEALIARWVSLRGGSAK